MRRLKVSQSHFKPFATLAFYFKKLFSKDWTLVNPCSDANSTTILLGFRVSPSQSNLSRAFFGKTFKDDPVSTKTWARVSPLHSTETCSMSLCFLLWMSSRHRRIPDHCQLLSWPHIPGINQRRFLVARGPSSKTWPKLRHVPQSTITGLT